MTKGGMWAVAQMVLLAAVLALGPVWSHEWASAAATNCARTLLIVSGAIAVCGFLTLGRNLTPQPKPRAQATLIRHGVYSLVRHPLYLSLILGSIGWAMFWRSLPALVLAAVLAFVLDAKARVEEHWLSQRFPEYADYARRVRRFIPWIY